MYNSAAKAYGRTSQQTVNPRELEAALLIKAAARLQSVIDDWENASPTLDEALQYNRKLWSVFVDAVTRSDCPLPAQVAQNIANLGLFVFNQTIALQVQPDENKVRSLITINCEIAGGLRGQAEAAAAAPATTE
ncbi:MAG: flagellar biosynthesis regulator FlaF [Hyphomicrobiaceae bacterium]|nr:flagellar biosynthesis regulator FlaF [Hyphomicrobiaceae bacterium]